MQFFDWYTKNILERLLRMKHWQVFLLFLFCVILTSIDSAEIWGSVTYYFLFLSWMHAVAILSFDELNQFEIKLLSTKTIHSTFFTLIFLIPLISFVQFENSNHFLEILIILSSISTCIVFFFCFYLAINRILMLEAKRKPDLGELMFKFLQVGFLFPFGIWGLQPLVQKLIFTNSEIKN